MYLPCNFSCACVRQVNSQFFLRLVHFFALAVFMLGCDVSEVVSAPRVKQTPILDWHYQYAGSGEEAHPHDVFENSHGDIVMVGEAGFVEKNTARIFVVCVDQESQLRWKRELGRPGYNFGNAVIESEDGHLVVAGSLNYNAAIFKLEINTGETVWSKSWDLGTEEAWGVVADPKGGWLVAAGTGDETDQYEREGHIAGSSGQWAAYIIKVLQDGTTGWEEVYSETGLDWAGEDICVTQDGGLIVANDCGQFGFLKLVLISGSSSPLNP